MGLISSSEKKMLLQEKTVNCNDCVEVKQNLGLLNCVTMTISNIVGTGIFVSPKGVLQEAGSTGMAIVIWIIAGIISVLGALCYVELGTTFPKSGCDYTYIQAIYGKMPAFLYLWVFIVILGPGAKAIVSLTFANYILQPFFPSCEIPQNARRLIAASVICLLTYINCRNVKWVTGLQNFFTLTKISALFIIIAGGIIYAFKGNSEISQKSFEGSRTNPGHIALALYSALFSYSGWNFLNYVFEELRDPFKNLPRCIYISMPLVTIIYVLANIAYFTVLTSTEILSSDAVAVTFGDHVLGVIAWVIPTSVILSTFGSLSGSIFAGSRLIFVGARDGLFPGCLSLINLHYFTPVPSLILQYVLCLAYLSTTEVYVLINYISFVDTTFLALSISGMIWLRYKQPDIERPIKVNIIMPIIYLIIQICLVLFPIYLSAWEACIGALITLAGIPIYFLSVSLQNKPQLHNRLTGKVTSFLQKLLLSVPEEKKDKKEIKTSVSQVTIVGDK